MIEYELYLDESGTFTEGENGPDTPKFPSQLAGILAPRGAFGIEEAEEVLNEVYTELNEALPEKIHATDLRRGERFDKLVTSLCVSLARRPKLQAVRLENREGLGFGAIEATYTRMIAELCVRILEGLAHKHRQDIGLHLFGARYMVEGEVQIFKPAYKSRIQEHIAYAAVRRGLARESSRFRLLGVDLASGPYRRELQVCDVLSNASHRKYKKLGPQAREKLRATFGDFDWTLTIHDLDRRVDDYLDSGLTGLALRELAEQLVGDQISKEARSAAEKRLPEVLDSLGALSAPARAPQLAVLDFWIEQIDEHRRDPELAYNSASWLLENVVGVLRERLADASNGLDSFELSLVRHLLTASNHRGALLDARAASRRFDELLPRVAGRWELGPVITEGLIAQAVHLTDCLEYDQAARRAQSVATYYGDLSSLLVDALPDVFPDTVRSEQRGKALGTWLQAEMYAGLKEPDRFVRARRLNEEAIDEFSTLADQDRQHQYRAQIETFAGDYGAARKHLASSLHTEPSHSAVANTIAELPFVAQGFALLHWWRLGATVLADGSNEERGEFEAALRESKLHTSRWCKEERLPYPAHGILRFQGVIEAHRRDWGRAESVIGRLHKLDAEVESHPLLALLVAAAQMEVAALLCKPQPKVAARLLDRNDTERRGAIQTLEAALPAVQELPAVAAWVEAGLAIVRDAVTGELGAARTALLRHAWLIAY